MPDFAVPAASFVATGQMNTIGSRGLFVFTGGLSSGGAWIAHYSEGAPPVPEIDWVRFHLTSGDTNMLGFLQVGVGDSASPTVICTLPVQSGGSVGNISAYDYVLPICVPPGALFYRAQATSGNRVIEVQAYFGDGDFYVPTGLGRVTLYGFSFGDLRATALQPGPVADVKGPWVPLTSSSYATSQLILGIDNRANTAGTTGNHLVDIAIGPITTSVFQVILQNISFRQNASPDFLFPSTTPPIPVQIPEGTAIWARQSSSITDATDRVIGLFALGID